MKRYFISFLQKVYSKIYGKIVGYHYTISMHQRENYLKRKRNKNKNKEISIIANSCVGGIIYHDLELRFLSPTINLFFDAEDYLEFLSDLEYYLNCNLIQKVLPEFSYPIGILKKGEKELIVHFLHYKSFEDAEEKWNKRSRRVDFNNLYAIFEYPHDIDKNHPYYLKFKQLPISKKRMITYAPRIHDKEVVHCPFYHDNYYSGKILKYPKETSKKRYLDHFNYVSFFNKS